MEAQCAVRNDTRQRGILKLAAADAAAPWPADVWRRELADAATSAGELLAAVGLPPRASAADAGFRVIAPRPYIARMARGDAADPLLLQVLPQRAETAPAPGYVADPLAEGQAMEGAGLMRKYAGRALLLAAGSCAVHCRYCFRRHFPYADHRQDSTFPALAAVRRDASIREVILSGGDPLMLTDAHFARLLRQIAAIGHVRRIRIHTRLPVAIPQRITADLLDALQAAPQRIVVVAHFNHPNELDADCARAMRALGGFALLNQSVLLRGINDDAETLAQLSEALFAAGVLPYYLHLPDAVAGTAHFDVPAARALALHRELAARLPGYLVPRLVREVPGADAKEPVAEADARSA